MRSIHSLAHYTPAITTLGMIFLFLLADHARLSYFLAYVSSLFVCALVMGYRGARKAIESSYNDESDEAEVSAETNPVSNIRAVYAFLLGIGIAATTGYAGQRDAFPAYPYADISRIDALTYESSVVYARATKIPVRVAAIYLPTATLSAQGRLDCFYNQQIDIKPHTTMSMRVRLQPAERHPKNAPRCTVTEIISQHHTEDIQGNISTLRVNIKQHIRALFEQFPKSTVPLLHALFLGERASLNTTIAERFRTAGLSHLLALSGMHLAIITVLGGIVLRFILGVRGARIGIVIFVIIYVWIIGNKPSLNRAAIMLIIWNIMWLFNKQTVVINVLAYAFIILTIGYAQIRYELSFQLSFSALAGLLMFADPIRKYMQYALPRFFAQPLSLTVAAQTISLSLLIYHFGVWYPVGLISSIVLTPLFTLFMWSALILSPLYFVPIDLVHVLIDRYMIILYAIVQQGVHVFSQFPAYQI